jgi:hypothetical protein
MFHSCIRVLHFVRQHRAHSMFARSMSEFALQFRELLSREVAVNMEGSACRRGGTQHIPQV